MDGMLESYKENCLNPTRSHFHIIIDQYQCKNLIEGVAIPRKFDARVSTWNGWCIWGSPVLPNLCRIDYLIHTQL